MEIYYSYFELLPQIDSTAVNNAKAGFSYLKFMQYKLNKI
jgi:hypothetical protein